VYTGNPNPIPASSDTAAHGEVMAHDTLPFVAGVLMRSKCGPEAEQNGCRRWWHYYWHPASDLRRKERGSGSRKTRAGYFVFVLQS
jgi:hypothetical protein